MNRNQEDKTSRHVPFSFLKMNSLTGHMLLSLGLDLFFMSRAHGWYLDGQEDTAYLRGKSISRRRGIASRVGRGSLGPKGFMESGPCHRLQSLTSFVIRRKLSRGCQHCYGHSLCYSTHHTTPPSIPSLPRPLLFSPPPRLYHIAGFSLNSLDFSTLP